MPTTPYISSDDELRELAAKIQRRRETARAALAIYGGNRLALIAALSRHSRSAQTELLDEQTTTPEAESAHLDSATVGRTVSTSRALLAVD